MVEFILKEEKKMLLNEILNIKYPLIQGAMANITDGLFAAQVSNAGALGIIATGAMNKEEARREIQICKEHTKKPFGVNIMLLNPHAEEIIALVCEEKVPFITTGAGNPAKYLAKLKENNVKVFPVVANVALAIRLERAGVDGLIVEGTESGGHVGEQTTLTLVPQICDKVKIPVVAAGGIADRRGFNAVRALGACGVQVGTVFLASDECKIHANYKAAVINARDSDTTVTGRSLNAPVRILKNEMSRKYLEIEKNLADRAELEKLTLGSLRRAVIEGDTKNGSLMMGQIAGLIKEIRPVATIIESICGE